MASILAELLPGSYLGASFLVESHQEQLQSRKEVVHQYPLKNTQFIQDLGRMPRNFQLKAIIGNDDGLYFSKRAALEEALSLDIAGILVHPFAGVFFVRQTKPATVQEDITTLSKAVFSLHFGETTSGVFPGAGGNLASKINSLSGPLRDAIKGAFE